MSVTSQTTGSSSGDTVTSMTYITTVSDAMNMLVKSTVQPVMQHGGTQAAHNTREHVVQGHTRSSDMSSTRDD